MLIEILHLWWRPLKGSTDPVTIQKENVECRTRNIERQNDAFYPEI
jgi:hypothetical protein